MHEVELKFGIPQNKLSALKKRIQTRTAQAQTLSAYYFDTPKAHLSKAKIAVRIRQENGAWVQTLKSKGDGIATRREENVTLVLKEPKPEDIVPDLSLFSASAQTLLKNAAALELLQNQLTLQYSTEVKRITRMVKRLGNVVEIAFDEGVVVAGKQSQIIQEIEFELLSGSTEFLLDTAYSWCKSFHLYLLTLSKAERGKRLQTGKAFAKAVKSDIGVMQLDKTISHAKFVQHAVENCLQHILPNISEIALASQDPNHVHQARVGMRRLRTALSSFSNFFDSTVDGESVSRWRDSLKHTFGLLGESRDLHILKNKTQPTLESCGAPSVAWQHSVHSTPEEAVKQTAFQLTLLELIAFSQRATTHDAHQPAKQTLSTMLDKLFNKIVKNSNSFAKLPHAEKHEVRKRLKKLRYIAEFAAPLYSNKKMNQFFGFLEPAQELLGEFNDAAVGQQSYLEKISAEPKAWFAVGWFAAREENFAEQCAAQLKAVKNAPRFWL